MRGKILEVRSLVYDHVHNKVVGHGHGRRLEIGLELPEGQILDGTLP